jgi:glucose-6-phosphate isomerase
MPSPPPIRFDYRNTLVTQVGEHGLRPEDFPLPAAKEALDAFRRRVESGQVGFPKLPEDEAAARAVARYAAGMRRQVEAVLVLGIGGSALGAYALDAALRGPHPVQTGVKKGHPRLVVLDNVDPGLVAATLENLDTKKTAVCVIAKSGATAETLSTFLIVHAWMARAMSARRLAARVVAVTDAHKGDLLAIARAEGYTTFAIPGNVGGRFSVFSAVGLLPAALTGARIERLLEGAREANRSAWAGSLESNLALQSAMIHHALDTRRGKTIEVVFAYSSYLWGAAFWYRQLWAESLGKRVNRRGEVVHTGQTPVAALGVTDQHSQVQLYMEGPADKMITFWRVEEPRKDMVIPAAARWAKYDSTGYLRGKHLSQLFEAERAATEAALTGAGRPNCCWSLARVDERHLGMFLQLLEFQTAFAGELYGIDAFDQPGVEMAKKLTNGLMGKKGFEEYARRLKRG